MKKTALPFAALACALFAAPALVHGQTLCSGPLKPTCIDMEFTYDSDVSIIRCDQDLKRYLAEAEEYVACLKIQIEETRSQMTEVEKVFQDKVGADNPADNFNQ